MNYNVRDDLKNLSVEEIKRLQPTNGAYAGFINIKNDMNMGVAIRSAALFGFSGVHIFGRRCLDRRPLVGCQNYIDIQRHYCMRDEETVDDDQILSILKDSGFFIVACDTYNGVEISEAVTNIVSTETIKPLFLFGNEGMGLSKKIVENSDMNVFIRQYSVMRSLNVSAAASIVMHQYALEKERYANRQI